MFNCATYERTCLDLRIPGGALLGENGLGFRSFNDGWNDERILFATKAIGNGPSYVERAARKVEERVAVGRPIGQNRGGQLSVAHAHTLIEAADVLPSKSAWPYYRGGRCGAKANMAKRLATEANWAPADACLDTHGGNGFLGKYDVERKFQRTRFYKAAPVGNPLVLTHVLGLPKSYGDG